MPASTTSSTATISTTPTPTWPFNGSGQHSALHASRDTRPTTAMGACRSCGAYGGSGHPSTCGLGHVIKLGPSLRAARDCRLSALVREQIAYQNWLVRNH